jgi:DNA-binding transcriptional MerR regulator
MADLPPEPPAGGVEQMVAIPRLAERTGVTSRVLRYWEELGLISPTREHGRLRYSPRDTAIARLTKRLVDSGVSLDGLGMLKELSQREVRRAGRDGDRRALTELALRILYERKAFRETTGMDEEHYPEGQPPPPPPGPHPPPPRLKSSLRAESAAEEPAPVADGPRIKGRGGKRHGPRSQRKRGW